MRSRQSGWRFAIKVIMDRAAAGIGLILLSPMVFLVSITILLFMGRPAFFFQWRPGRWARPFRVVKFRTMTDARGPDGELLPSAQRINPLGRFLRATSLDEIPQLWNVLRGDLSLVGPRPLRMRYLERYTPEQARRHEVLPGITGWAQINGRNAISWEDKFELDVWYVDQWSLRLDLRILLTTVLKVLRREGIAPRGQATVSEFLGSANTSGRDGGGNAARVD